MNKIVVTFFTLLLTVINSFCQNSNLIFRVVGKENSENVKIIFKNKFGFLPNSKVSVNGFSIISYEKKIIADTLGSEYKFEKNFSLLFYPTKNKTLFLGKQISDHYEATSYELGLYTLNGDLIKSFNPDKYFTLKSVGRSTKQYFTAFGDFITIFSTAGDGQVLTGLVDQQGTIVIEPTSGELGYIGLNYFYVLRNNKLFIYDAIKKALLETDFENLKVRYDSENDNYLTDGKIIVFKNEKYGLYDLKIGKLFVPVIYDNLEYIVNEKSFVNRAGSIMYENFYLDDDFYATFGKKVGIINSKNQVVIPINFQPFNFVKRNNLTKCQNELDKINIYDVKNKTLLFKVFYENIPYKDEKIIICSDQEGKLNIFNIKKNKFVFETFCEEIKLMNNAIFFVSDLRSNLNLIYDSETDLLIAKDKKIEAFKSFTNNLFVLTYQDQTKSLFSTTLKKNISTDFSDAFFVKTSDSISNDYFIIKTPNNESYIIDTEGKIVVKSRKMPGLVYFENNYFVNYLTNQRKLIISVFDLNGNQIDNETYKSRLKN